MHAHIVLPMLLLIPTTIRAATIAQIVASNGELTKIADTVDAAVVEITAQSGVEAAQQIPRNLYSLTRAVGHAGFNDTRSSTEPTLDPALEDTFTQSYGLFTNTIEELMFDLYDKETILASYYQRNAIYRQILYFNSTFVRYSTFMHGVVGDELHQNLTRNATANAMGGIVNATGKYAPGQAVLLFEA